MGNYQAGGGYILFTGNSVTAHPLTRLGNLGQHILPSQVASSQHTSTDRKTFAIAPEPAPRGTDHDEDGWRYSVQDDQGVKSRES